MTGPRYLFTSESVTEGHPDKLCDRISDAVLDAVLDQDPMSRVACETLVTTDLCVVAGEITTTADVDIEAVARRAIREVGYNHETGFDWETVPVQVAVQSQSPDIAMGVDEGGAGDQGMMFGYACSETPELMPLPIMLAHKLCRRLAEVRRDRTLPYLRPDGKSQVTVEYDGATPVRIDKVLIAAHHAEWASQHEIYEDVCREVIAEILPPELFDSHTQVLVNPTGRFSVGGPNGDTGLTGRKIIVDTYGGMACHGGGCFSGKCPTKVDRSAAYMMRYVAKNVVAAGLADRCEIQVAYAIGQKDPLSVMVDTFGTGTIADHAIADLILRTFDLTPRGIIEKLDLRRPIYTPTSAYGHFGRTDIDAPWEQTDMAEVLYAEVTG